MDRIYDYEKAVNSIMGSTPDPEIYESIKNCILGCKGVYGVHDLIVHDYGPEIICYSACRAGQLIDLYAKP